MRRTGPMHMLAELAWMSAAAGCMDVCGIYYSTSTTCQPPAHGAVGQQLRSMLSHGVSLSAASRDQHAWHAFTGREYALSWPHFPHSTMLTSRKHSMRVLSQSNSFLAPMTSSIWVATSANRSTPAMVVPRVAAMLVRRFWRLSAWTGATGRPVFSAARLAVRAGKQTSMHDLAGLESADAWKEL